jgi:hypothetical protein
MADKISKIEERRERKAQSKVHEESEDEGEEQGSDDARVQKKKFKNVEKIIKYHKRKRRDFK